MPLFEFQVLCADSGDQCDFVKSLTPRDEGFTILESSLYDDFDHKVRKEFNNNKEVLEVVELIRKKAKNSLVDLKVIRV